MRRLGVPILLWCVSDAAFSASVGVNGVACQYNTLQAALAVAPPGAVIRLAEGATIGDGGFTITQNVTITTGDAGCQNTGTTPATVTGSGRLGAIVVGSTATVTVDNVVVTAHVGNQGGNFVVQGELTLTDAVVTGGRAAYGAGVFVDGGGELVVSGATEIVDNNATTHGGGIFLDHTGLLTLTDTARIADNSADQGGGIYAIDSVQVTGAVEIDDNTAYEYGGGVYLLWNGTTAVGALSVDCPCSVSGNHANLAGGGLYAAGSGSNATFDGGALVASNDADDPLTGDADGGGAWSEGTLALLDVDITGNFAGRDGGGIYSTGFLEASSLVTLSGNTATEDGGGIWTSGDADLLGPTLTLNVADADGGAIYVDDAVLDAYGGVWDHNTADNGGALYAAGGDTYLEDLEIADNTARFSGGGIRTAGADLEAVDTEWRSNAAQNGSGGGMSLTTGTYALLKGARILLNTASTNGGGVHLLNHADLTLLGSLVEQNTATSSGGGIHATSTSSAMRPTLSMDGPRGPLGACVYTSTGTSNDADRYCSEIRLNTAATGGGLSFEHGDATLNRTAFFDNEATTDGFAIVAGAPNGDPVITLKNTLIHDHDAPAGDHVVIAEDGAILHAEHVTVAGNTGTAVLYEALAAGTFYRSIVWDGDFEVDAAVVYVDCTSFDTITGITGAAALNGSYVAPQDPVFQTTPRGGFRLNPLFSPAVNACGSGLAKDLDSFSRGSLYDRGALEAQ